jgi:transposase-like protein
MRKLVEQHFESQHGGAHLVPWLFQQKQEGASLRELAERLRVLTGIQVSHVTIRNWMMEG